MDEYFLYRLACGRATYERELGRETQKGAEARGNECIPGRDLVFTEGWDAGRHASLLSAAQVRGAAKQNPHEADPGRRRWDEGFAKGAGL